MKAETIMEVTEPESGARIIVEKITHVQRIRGGIKITIEMAGADIKTIIEIGTTAAIIAETVTIEALEKEIIT